MNEAKYSFRNGEFFKGNELNSGVFDSPSTVDDPMPRQTHGPVEGQGAQEDALSKEREEFIESWMNNIKAFIRGIDVNSL